MTTPECNDILNLIPLYVDNLLDEEESQKVKEHILSCPECKKEAEFMMSIMSKTKDLPKVVASSDFTAKVVAKANSKKSTKTRTILLRRISSGVAVAAVLTLCVVGLDFIKTETPEPEKSTMLSAEKVSQASPDIIDIPKTEHSKKTTPNIQEKTVVPDESAETHTDETVESFIPAAMSEIELEYFTIATVELTDENRETVEELIKDYEKDDFGYIVPDMNVLLRKLCDSGIKVTTEVSPDKINDYIIIR